MSDDPYLWPGTAILRNKLNIRSAAALDRVERRLVTQRTIEGVPGGDFDLAHLRAIHLHLFQDVYDWAGQIRTVEMSKGGSQFQFRQYIQTGMDYVYRQIVEGPSLKGLSRANFAARAGEIIGNVNYVHPFREGNGRTQLQYLRQLATWAGHSLDLTKLDKASWLHASTEAHQARYGAMAESIEAALAERTVEQTRPSGRTARLSRGRHRDDGERGR